MKGLNAEFFNGKVANGRAEYLSQEDRDVNLRYSLVSLISIAPGITTNKLWAKVKRLRPGYTLQEYESVLKRILGDEAHCTDSRWWLK